MCHLRRSVVPTMGAMALAVSHATGAVVPVAEDLVFADGLENCSLLDADADRISGCDELSALLSTNPADDDTDDDGIDDGDEVFGTEKGLNLPSFGVKPRRKDLLLEIDWMEDASECPGAHSHRPEIETIWRAQAFYALAPISNPDGSTGFNLIVDMGQGGAHTGGNVIAAANPNVDRLGAIYQGLKAVNFDPRRTGYFHYQMHVHRHGVPPNDTRSGIAEIVGDDSIVSLECRGVAQSVLNTILHELGHNLGLRHGGDSDCDGKPNYDSIMNRRNQFKGQDRDCNGYPDHASFIGYSAGRRIDIDENALDERLGVCRSDDPAFRPVDWNGNGITTEFGLKIDLNAYQQQAMECGSTYSVLRDFDDWANIRIASGLGAPGGGAIPPDDVVCADNSGAEP